jgi:hypothetical protein
VSLRDLTTAASVVLDDGSAIDYIQKAIERQQHSGGNDFSPWRYMPVSKEDMISDMECFKKLLDTGEPIVPAFIHENVDFTSKSDQ